MNAIQTIQYEDGQRVPIVNQAVYLGTTITGNGKYHAEISARIAASMTTFNKQSILGTQCNYPENGNSEYTTQLLLYGLESASLSNADKKRLDAFSK